MYRVKRVNPEARVAYQCKYYVDFFLLQKRIQTSKACEKSQYILRSHSLHEVGL